MSLDLISRTSLYSLVDRPGGQGRQGLTGVYACLVLLPLHALWFGFWTDTVFIKTFYKMQLSFALCLHFSFFTFIA